MTHPSDSFSRARDVALAVRQAGGRALIVGGWVRDQQLAQRSGEIDIEVYGIPAPGVRDILAHFGRVDTVGESFTVYKVADLDVALPRRESRIGRGHRAFEVTGDPWMSVAEAVRRRDFTINAMLFDPLTEELIDPAGGRQDLQDRLLRAVDVATFGDDSLRVLRALQFAARFGLRMDGETRRLCASLPLDDLARERIGAEVEKLLLAPAPSVGLELGRDLGVLDRLFPELATLVECPQDPEWHPEGDVWVHTCMVADRARGLCADLDRCRTLAIMYGAVCHDLGKPLTTAVIDGRLRSPNHEPLGVAPAESFLDRVHVHTIDGYDVRAQVLGMVQYHLAPGMWHKAPSPVGDGAFRRLARKVDLELLARLAKADCLGRTGEFDCSAMDWFLERARALGVEHRAPDPILKGRHLLAMGVAPGPGVGRVLRSIYEQQLDGSVTNLEEATAAARSILAGGTGKQ